MRRRTALIIAALLLSFSGFAQTSEIHQYFVELAQREPTENHRVLAAITDRRLMNTKMDVAQMSDYIKSTPWQTQMVYSYSKMTVDGRMTPLQFVHSLADDLFKRKALQPFVSKKQKDGLILRLNIMEWANAGRSLSIQELEELDTAFDKSL